jgi:monoamine oxidase
MDGTWRDQSSGAEKKGWPAMAHPSIQFFITGSAADAYGSANQVQTIVHKRLGEFFVKSYPGRRQPVIKDMEIAGWLDTGAAFGKYQQWIKGGPTAVMGPGKIDLWPYLKGREDNLIWAGTEASTRWGGYMEGAVEAGLVAARTVLAETGGEPHRSDRWPR